MNKALDDFVQALEPFRPRLQDVSLEGITPRSFDSSELQGKIAERLVRQWLEATPDVSYTDLESHQGDYDLACVDEGVLVQDRDGRVMHSYDFVVDCRGGVYFIEVKSNKINGFTQKVERSYQIGRRLFGERARGNILFLPITSPNKRESVADLEADHPLLRCVNTAYRKRDMTKAMERLCQRY